MNATREPGKYRIGKTVYDEGGWLEFAFYAVGSNPYERIAISLVDEKTDHEGPRAVLTVNFPEIDPEPGCVWVKTWSKNTGIYDALIASGYVQFTGRVRYAGHAVSFEMRLRDDVYDYARAEIAKMREWHDSMLSEGDIAH